MAEVFRRTTWLLIGMLEFYTSSVAFQQFTFLFDTDYSVKLHLHIELASFWDYVGWIKPISPMHAGIAAHTDAIRSLVSIFTGRTWG